MQRSDVWALGVVLYEMAAGRRPFRGGTAYELSASILREAPPAISPMLPPVLQSVIDKCLDKDPTQRYRSGGEVRAALEAAATASRSQRIPVEALALHEEEQRAARMRRRLWYGVGVFAVVVLAIGMLLWKAAKPRMASKRGAWRDSVACGVAAGESVGRSFARLFLGWDDGRADYGIVAHPEVACDFADFGDAIQGDAEVAGGYCARS